MNRGIILPSATSVPLISDQISNQNQWQYAGQGPCAAPATESMSVWAPCLHAKHHSPAGFSSGFRADLETSKLKVVHVPFRNLFPVAARRCFTSVSPRQRVLLGLGFGLTVAAAENLPVGQGGMHPLPFQPAPVRVHGNSDSAGHGGRVNQGGSEPIKAPGNGQVVDFNQQYIR